MQRVITTILVCILMIGCSDDEPATDQGCLTGIPKAGWNRVLIRCCTNKQYLAGSNTSAGGTSSWDLYTGHQWAKCSDCK
jgi:hypothetical protein